MYLNVGVDTFLPISLGANTYLTFPLGLDDVEIMFKHKGRTTLYLRIEPETAMLVANRQLRESWAQETHESVTLKAMDINTIHVELDEADAVIAVNGRYACRVKNANLHRAATLISASRRGVVLWSDTEALKNTWRLDLKSSGKIASNPTVGPERPLRRGLSAVIRAHNEQANIYKCITQLAPYLDEVIAVDNCSSDGTYQEMMRAQAEHFNVKIHSYSIKPPRVGAPHRLAVQSNSSNTLGRYYNYCLAQTTTHNFIKWDADFLPIAANLKEMLARFQLRDRSDCFSVWFSGLSIWTDGHRYWIDKSNLYNEFRCHSKLHGAKWVDLPDWEEMDQSYLYAAQKYFFDKPVFVEIFHIDPLEFEKRGVVKTDERDLHRYNAISHYKERGTLPHENFAECDLEDILAGTSALCSSLVSDAERSRMEYMELRFGSVPEQYLTVADAEHQRVNYAEVISQPTLAVLCITHAGNRDRIEAIRATLQCDFAALKIPFFFVIGTHKDTYLDGDVLYVKANDFYEGLAEKVSAAIEYIYTQTSIQHVLKIDDDCYVNATSLIQFPYWRFDYVGGGISGGRDAIFNWHAGKCRNEQLNRLLVNTSEIARWYGGGFSYFLSRKAIKEILVQKRIVDRTLYEDYAIGRALAAVGLFSDNATMMTYPMIHFNASMHRNYNELIGVFDIPSHSDFYAVAERMRTCPAYYRPERMAYARFDWFNWDAFNAEMPALSLYSTEDDFDFDEEEQAHHSSYQSLIAFDTQTLQDHYVLSPRGSNLADKLIKVLTDGSPGVLLHPTDNELTLIAIPWQRETNIKRVRADIMIEHADASDIEFGFALMEKNSTLDDFTMIANSRSETFSGWQALKALEHRSIEIKPSEYPAGNLSLYLATRLSSGGTTAYGWATWRNITVEPCSEC